MRRLVLLTVVSMLVVAVLSGFVHAAETTVWKVSDTGAAIETDLARAFTGGTYNTTYCNADRQVQFQTKAEVAQWLELTVLNTEWRWYVRKPGTYFADCISGKIKSNGDVLITFSGFGPLLDISLDEDVVNPDANRMIKTWYGYSL